MHHRIAQIRQEATNLKQNLEKLRASADQYSDLSSDPHVCAYRMAPDGTIVAASPALMRMLGYESLDDLRANNPDGDEYDAVYVQALFARHSGEVTNIKSIWRCKDGSLAHVRESASATYDDQGRPIAYSGVIEEIVGPEQADAPQQNQARAATREPLVPAPMVEPPPTELPSLGQASVAPPSALGETNTPISLKPAALASVAPLPPIEVPSTSPLFEQPGTGIQSGAQRASDGMRHPVAPAAAGAPSLAPEGTGLNGTVSRVSTVQRAVERLRGQVHKEIAGEGRHSPLGGSMELREYWKIIWKRLWLIVLLMLIGGAATGYVAYQQPPLYRSTTTLYLNPAAANALMSYQYDTLDSLARTYTEFMKTRSFASRVAEKLTLSTGTIIGALSTEYVANTQFYRITATYTDPELTQSLANIAAQVLIDQNIARQQAQQEQIKAQASSDPERERLIEVRTSLQNELDLYNSQLTTVQAKVDELMGQPKSEATDKQILTYQSQLTTLHASRLSAINGLANTQAALTTTEATDAPNLDTAVVVDAAPLPGGPLPDTTMQSILIALLAAMSIGAALAFLLEYMDYTIKTPEAMEAIYGMGIQGAIGLAGGKRAKDRSPSQLITLTDSLSPMAESFRALRTGVGVAGLISEMRSVMITSARPGEGKTFVASNLAVSLAQNGSRVILVDSDLRKPSLHYVFDLPLDPGFTNLVLNQTSTIEDFLQPTSVENLRVLTCGIIPPNPAELLGSPRAAAVMEQLAQHADIVVYDTPPAATVVDAIVIGPRVNAVLHVIKAGSTRIDLVRRCKALLERGGAHILGPVLNQVSLPDLQSYSYYYSYNYKQEGRKRGKRAKEAPNSAKASANGSAVRSK